MNGRPYDHDLVYDLRYVSRISTNDSLMMENDFESGKERDHSEHRREQKDNEN